MKQVKCKVVILSTEKVSKIISNGDHLEYCFKEGIPQENWIKPHHLYILSEEDIKENDWYCVGMKTSEYGIVRCDSKRLENLLKNERDIFDKQEYFKVIATTDSSLLNLPKPTEGFIKKFVEKYNKKEPITDIFVEFEEIPSYEDNLAKTFGYDYELKLSSQNEITIHPVKQSWTKEEVINLCNTLFVPKNWTISFDKWIEENL